MKYKAIILTLLLTLGKVKAQGDCDYLYSRQAVDHIIKWNQLNIYLPTQLRNILQKSSQTFLSIDTSIRDNWIIYNNYSLSKGGPYELIFRDSINNKQKVRLYSIKDLSANREFHLMTSSFVPDYFYYPDFFLLNNQIVFYNITKYRKYEIVFFDIERKEVHTIRANSINEPKGKSDSSFFILIQDKVAKIDNQKFKRGEFVSISKNGAHKIVGTDNFAKDSTLEFCNLTFTAQQVLTSRVTNDCVETDYYKTYIYNKEKRIDSVPFQVVRFANNDIPKIDYNLGRLTLHNKDFFKIYYRNGDVYTWDSNYWTDKLEILQKCQDKTFLLTENKLFVVVHTDLTKHKDIIMEADLTLNNLNLDKSATDFQTILMFDIKTNEFIGYPTIVFEKY
jgi:hypothetical protein